MSSNNLSIPVFQPYGLLGDGLQTDFVFAPQHFALANGGIGSGKSIGGAMRAIMAACGYLGGQQSLKVPNVGVVTAPTYTMLKDATIRTFMDYAGGLVIKYNKNDKHAILANGSEILFRSADNPDNLRGPTISWWWGDEAAYCHKSVWQVMIGRLRQFGTLGYAWLTTTPKGRNWIWQEFIQRSRNDYSAFRLPTWANPFLEPAIYETWAEAYVGDFARQELDGEFIAFQGLIYPEFDRAKHVTTKQVDRYRYAMAGVDWGYNNPGVILVGVWDGDSKLTIVHEEYQRKRNIEDWVTVAKQLQERWRIDTFYCDPSEPDHILKFQDQGLNAVKADNSVTAGIQAVKARLMKNAVRLDSQCANTIVEAEQYQWMAHPDGYRDAPVKANDHAMDALRYLIFNHDERQTETVTVGGRQVG